MDVPDMLVQIGAQFSAFWTLHSNFVAVVLDLDLLVPRFLARIDEGFVRGICKTDNVPGFDDCLSITDFQAGLVASLGQVVVVLCDFVDVIAKLTRDPAMLIGDVSLKTEKHHYQSHDMFICTS